MWQSAESLLNVRKGVRVYTVNGLFNVNLSFPRVNRGTEITRRRNTQHAKSMGISTSAKNTLQIQL